MNIINSIDNAIKNIGDEIKRVETQPPAPKTWGRCPEKEAYTNCRCGLELGHPSDHEAIITWRQY